MIKKILAASALALVASSVCASTPAKKPKAKPASASATANADEPDVKDHRATEFSCEMGNKVTVYTNPGDAAHIALRWNKHLHLLTRVETSTGANRFENKQTGLIWLDIPAKGMLLDSKLNRQLANECKNPEQQKTPT